MDNFIEAYVIPRWQHCCEHDTFRGWFLMTRYLEGASDMASVCNADIATQADISYLCGIANQRYIEKAKAGAPE